MANAPYNRTKIGGGKTVFATLAGFVVAVVIIAFSQWISSRMFPLPEGLDPHDREALAEWIENLPITAFLVVLGGYAVGSFVGGWLSAVLSERPFYPALVVGVFLTAFGVIEVINIPQPLLYAVGSVVVYIPLALIGGRFGARST